MDLDDKSQLGGRNFAWVDVESFSSSIGLILEATLHFDGVVEVYVVFITFIGAAGLAFAHFLKLD